MAEESAPAPDETPLTAVLEALNDPDCRAILRETAEPMTATELIDACDIPKSTLYRKLDRLGSAALLRERDTINPEGGRTTTYERDFETVLIAIEDDDTFSVAVNRPSRGADERLADIWSAMGDEL
ncbi:helix-turn-helix transcriptional regulator [Halosimplex litoreum]|uniref:Helix-turn-helix transcriptional regulator n=1 Tax=Halosimplex litoreum TaxID=1198301 RepID=A0A7T3KUD2_9EURY|nr:helix-turn-helix domain-containing protein [Halosimplex litoreum]QPV61635.1 helix-turn-helix transcriptional regulator [Halosimplex litoreum]